MWVKPLKKPITPLLTVTPDSLTKYCITYPLYAANPIAFNTKKKNQTTCLQQFEQLSLNNLKNNRLVNPGSETGTLPTAV